MTNLSKEEAEAKFQELDSKLDSLTKDVQDLVAAWKAASWLVGAVKWFAGIATAIMAIILLIREVK